MLSPMSGTGINQFFLGCAIVFSLAVLPGSLEAQVYSGNIVGYYNLVLQTGDNLVANQLDNGTNTLNDLFAQSVPEGTTFTEWNASQLAWSAPSIYDTNSGWSINYALNYGQGGLLDAPATFTNTFVGSVWPGFNPVGPFTPPLVTADGVLLLSSVIPIDDATFYDVIGRDPLNGENVTWLDPATQRYTTSVFEDGTWSNGDPLLDVGQSAFYGLGGNHDSSLVQATPEPATFSLVAAGTLALVSLRAARGRRPEAGDRKIAK
jgi:hypothetical protein